MGARANVIAHEASSYQGESVDTKLWHFFLFFYVENRSVDLSQRFEDYCWFSRSHVKNAKKKTMKVWDFVLNETQ